MAQDTAVTAGTSSSCCSGESTGVTTTLLRPSPQAAALSDHGSQLHHYAHRSRRASTSRVVPPAVRAAAIEDHRLQCHPPARERATRLVIVEKRALVDVLGMLCCLVGTRYTPCATSKKQGVVGGYLCRVVATRYTPCATPKKKPSIHEQKRVNLSTTGASLMHLCRQKSRISTSAGYGSADAVSSCSPSLHDSRSFNNFSNIGLQFF